MRNKTFDWTGKVRNVVKLCGESQEDSAVATVCEVLAVCAVFGGAELSLKNQRYIFLLLF